MVWLQTEFPRTHDLGLLRGLLPAGWSVRDVDANLSALTEWAVESRYPGDWPDATGADAAEAVEWARAVTDAAGRDLASRGLPQQ